MRLSRILRRPTEHADAEEAVPLRRALLWVLFALALAAGVVLYFKYERLVVPLIT